MIVSMWHLPSGKGELITSDEKLINNLQARFPFIVALSSL